MIVLLIKSEYRVCFINTNCFVSTGSCSVALFIDFCSPTTKLQEGNVFSRVFLSVCHSVRWGVPCDYYQWCTGPHQTGTSDLSPGLPSTPNRDPRHGHVLTWISLYRGIPPTHTHLQTCWTLTWLHRDLRHGHVLTWISLYRGIPPPHTHLQTYLTWTWLHRDPPPHQTCLNLFIMKHAQSTSGRLASYWNAFLWTLMIFCADVAVIKRRASVTRRIPSINYLHLMTSCFMNEIE